MDRRWSASLAAVTLGGALLVPSAAAAEPGGIPPIPVDGRHPAACSAVKATFRVTVAQARTRKQASYVAAKAAWFAGIATERQQLAAALARSESKRETRAAVREFRKDTADERLARASTRRQALLRYRATVKSAHRKFQRDWATCH